MDALWRCLDVGYTSNMEIEGQLSLDKLSPLQGQEPFTFYAD